VARRIWGLAVAIGLVAALAGCGGGGGGDETSSQLTKAEFAKQGNEICAQRKKEWESDLVSFNKKFGNPKKPPNQVEKRETAEDLLQETLLPAMIDQQESLEDLGAPEGKQKQYDAMMKSLSEVIASLEKDGVGALLEGEYSKFSKEAEEDLGLNCPL
jgi:hypothetical protein